MPYVDYKRYILSKEWASVRADVILAAGGKCERCGKDGTQVHHLFYANLGNEEPEDLILLCPYHHMLEHGLAKKPSKRRKKKRKKQQPSSNKQKKVEIGHNKCCLCKNPIKKQLTVVKVKERNFSGNFHKKCAAIFSACLIKKGTPKTTKIRRKNA